MRSPVTCQDGTAAAELALVLPILLLLLFGAAEIGNFFMSEHTLVKGVRDGARYAARQSFTNYNGCSGSPPQAVVDSTKNLVRTGVLTGGTDRLPNWTDGATQFTVTVACKTTTGGQSMGGIYADATSSSGGALGAPVVTVFASVPYQSLVGYAGIGVDLTLNASQQAAVMGI